MLKLVGCRPLPVRVEREAASKREHFLPQLIKVLNIVVVCMRAHEKSRNVFHRIYAHATAGNGSCADAQAASYKGATLIAGDHVLVGGDGNFL